MGQRAYCRLTARKVAGLREPGRYADGDGLYLLIDPSGAKRWVLRYALNGKRRDMGLGPARVVSLSDARAKALKAKQQILDGTDPISARKGERALPRLMITHVRFMRKLRASGKTRNTQPSGSLRLRLMYFPFLVIGNLSKSTPP